MKTEKFFSILMKDPKNAKWLGVLSGLSAYTGVSVVFFRFVLVAFSLGFLFSPDPVNNGALFLLIGYVVLANLVVPDYNESSDLRLDKKMDNTKEESC